MALQFSTLGNFTGSIFSGSYLGIQDAALFATSQSSDIFFGYSPRDITELTVFDTFDNQISWNLLDKDKMYSNATLTYTDALSNVQSYTYTELINQFITYRSKLILLDPINDLSSSGIFDGTFKQTYIFSRNMAGSSDEHLVINDVSPSRTEIKLLPKVGNTIPYASFCIKKFPISDISAILLSVTQTCQYDKIYQLMYHQYTDSILFLQSLFFLPDDGSTITFLKNLYEDFIKYTNLSTSQLDAGFDPTRIYRIQGIKSYFNNYILQGYNIIASFDDIEKQFDSFVNFRIEQVFSQYKGQTGQNYINAKKFCYDFFTTYYYDVVIHSIQSAHQKKYFSFFKNVLNFGNNKFFPILTHDYLDERVNITDPLTLIVKLGSELPADISSKDECWVSNFGMNPFVFTTILQNPIKYKTYTIGPPDFGTPTQFINKQNVNKLYSSQDLSLANQTNNDITINRNMSKLSTDFSNFNNFIVFSSATARINIFKNKSISFYNLSSSLSSIEEKYINSISSSIPYPYFKNETDLVQSQMDDIINSFDAYESYLFDSGNYIYIPRSLSFINLSFVTDYDDSALTYDKNNRDSLINNVPEYIITDSNNQDYITFLAMIGHHFDNIYTYISALPIEKHISNNAISGLPLQTLKELLYSFGWNVDDIINSLNIDDVYLNSLYSSTYNALSAQDRLKIIWNRILVTLPGIYKTKGTEACVNYLMSCYGLPSSLISIREYGGTDYSQETTPTYQFDEKTYMLKFSGISDRIEGPFPQSTQTIEFKFAVENEEIYENYQRVSLFTLYPYGNSSPAWSVDIYKVPGQYTGKVILQMKSGSTGISIVSDPLPIFNGDIFSIMVRRNDSDAEFEINSNYNPVPLEYDLVVQRNEDGRRIFYSTSSAYFYQQDNEIFSQYGRFWLSNGSYVGTLDKLNIWNVPIGDNDFEEHVNDLNSYGYSDSVVYQNLLVRINFDYPTNVNTGSPSVYWIPNISDYYAIPNYRTSNWISSSIVPLEYSASLDIINTLWRPVYPSGSVDIYALNFPIVIDPNWSASFNKCNWISSSVYPYSFREFTYQENIDSSKYGPNKFKNKKIRKVDYSIEARFDVQDRSTFDSNASLTGESNQLGFFIDPQDSKNKDIIRYIGKTGVMNLIGDPRNLYSDKYYDLINKNNEYNSIGNKKTLFNEMLTVYKFYFDKSIFEAIKNIIPARSNLFTGVIIEPTILERPKYQNRPINSELKTTVINDGIIKNNYSFSENLLWADFNTNWNLINDPHPSYNPLHPCVNGVNLQKAMANSMPPSYQQVIDLSDLNIPKREYSKNFLNGYIPDYMDKIQYGFYPDYENINRNWTLSTGQDPSLYYSYIRPIGGTVSVNNLNNIPSVDIDPGVPNSSFWAGYNLNDHFIPHYLIKVWDKYSYYEKTGEYSHTNIPLEDTYASNSVFLYKYLVVDEFFMRSLVYYTDLISLPIYDVGDISNTFNVNFLHKAGTFIGTPDQTVSNVHATLPVIWSSDGTPHFSLNIVTSNTYFEVVHGYPRNHYIHKMERFSKIKHPEYLTINTSTIYVKGKQTINTTINSTGISDGTYPVISNNVSNVNVVNAGNVIQSIPSNTGTVIPGGSSNTTNASSGATQLLSLGNGGIVGITSVGTTKVAIVDNNGKNIGWSDVKLTTQQIKTLKINGIITIDGVNYKTYGSSS